MLLVCPECEMECTVDEASAETATCPGCGVQLHSHTEATGVLETKPGEPKPLLDAAALTRDYQEGVLDLLPTPEQLPRQLGRYRLTQLLGEGGFAHVYRAFDSELSREVALKVPRKDRFSTKQKLSQFLEEARVCAKLEHPGIVRIYDVGWLATDVCFIAMELCSGGSMDLIAKRAEKVAPQRAAELVADIAEAIHVAHLKGLVHRDLKPSNIMFGADGRPRIADFGLAMPEELQLDHPGEVAGTLPYMSPEQVRGESHLLDGRSDIWSLGAILYQLLSGRRPFLGDQRQLTEQILKREPKPLRQVAEDVPVELEHICLKCLRKPISDRWATARDLADQLRNWLNASRRSSTVAVAVPLPAPLRERSGWWRTGIGQWGMATGLICAASLFALALPAGKRIEEGQVERAKAGLLPLAGVYADWSMNEAIPHRQYPLLLRTPRKLAWPVPGESSSVDHSPDEAKLSITSNQLTLIELGETQTTEFKLDVDLYKNALVGKSGFFWGYHVDPENEDRSNCLAIYLNCFPGRKSAPTYAIAVSHFTFQRASSGEVGLVARQDLVSELVNSPSKSANRLVVRIGPTQLKEVEWNGHALKELAAKLTATWSSPQPPIAAYRSHGSFGLLNEFGSTLARNANFTAIKGAQQ